MMRWIWKIFNGLDNLSLKTKENKIFFFYGRFFDSVSEVRIQFYFIINILQDDCGNFQKFSTDQCYSIMFSFCVFNVRGAGVEQFSGANPNIVEETLERRIRVSAFSDASWARFAQLNQSQKINSCLITTKRPP